MLVTFKSKAAADIIMYESHAQPFLDLLGKDSKRGIITAAETAHALSVLEQKMAESRAGDAPRQLTEQELETLDKEEIEDIRRAAARHVTFSARFFPLLDMLRAAGKKQCDIVWGT